MMMPLFVIIFALVFSVSCSKKAVTANTESMAGTSQGTDSTEQTAIYEEDSAKSAEIEDTETGNRFMMIMLEDIYFEFDKSTLTREAQETLTKKARWLRSNTDVKVIVEGHCDERGTNEYNLALGDRRAASTKAFLVDLGISPSRLITISYGEERPLTGGNNEDAWAKNRRAHFAVE
jgi:peptidoglycan-associated lipoprotein